MSNDDGLDVPAFLKISAADRSEAWRTFQPMTSAGAPVPNDIGPGSACRRAGIPDGMDAALVESVATMEAAKATARRDAYFAFCRRKTAEAAELEAVRVAARAQKGIIK